MDRQTKPFSPSLAITFAMFMAFGVVGLAGSSESTTTDPKCPGEGQSVPPKAEVAATPIGKDAPATAKHYVAFSLKVAQALIRKAQRDHNDFRQDRVLFGLGGMNKPKALFFDAKNSDWILLGERTVDAGDLTLDDFAVALRTRLDNPSIDPGVTIDPIPPGQEQSGGDPAEWRGAKRLRVKFFGSVANTRFGLTCYQADWLMKQVGLGLETFPTANIPSLFDLSRKERREDTRTTIVSRFWLCPVQNEVPVLQEQKAVFIQHSRIVVNTQTLFAERGGQIVHDKDELNALDTVGRGFSQAFTDHYDDAAHDRPALERLRGLARLAGLAKGIVVGRWAGDFHYFLSDYTVQPVETPQEVDVIANEDRSMGLRVQGGVQLRNLAIRLRNGDINALLEAVTKMRPMNPETVSWEFVFGDTFLPLPNDYANIGFTGKSDLVKIAPDELIWLQKAANDGDADAMLNVAERYLDGNVGLPKDPRESFRWIRKAAELGNAVAECDLADYYSRGTGIGQDYSEAMKWCERALELKPDLAEAWGNKGALLGKMNRNTEALKCCERALELKPDLAEVHCNKGALLGNMNRNADALTCYDRAIEIKPSYAKPWSNKSAALRLLGRKDEALKCSERALELDPKDAEAWGNKAAALGSLTRCPEELQSCERALELDPDLAIGWFNKGSALFHLGRFDEALTSFDRALKLTPNDADTWLSRGITLYSMKRYGEARGDITKAAELGSANARNALKILEREGH